MSGSKEKQKRMQGAEMAATKRERALAEEKKQKNKSRNLAIGVVAIVVVLLLIALLINSNFIRRHGTAVKVDNMEFTVSDYNFFYQNSYYELVNYIYTYNAEYASSMLPDTSKPFESQQYDDDRTWDDYLNEFAQGRLTRYVALYNEGKAAGFELSESDMAEFQEELDHMETTALSYGYSSVDDYVSAYYGKSVTFDILKKNLELITYANKYEEYFNDSLEYTHDEIAAQYESNKGLYDLFEYRYFNVASETVTESDYETDEEYQAAKDAVAADSHAKAEAYAKRVKAGESLDDIAREFDSEKYAETDSTLRQYNGNVLGSVYGDWLRDESRKTGDVEIFDITTGTYVVQYIGRSDNHYNTVNMRTISVEPAYVSQSLYPDDEEGYNAALEEAKEGAKQKADELYQQWKDEGGDVDAFAELAKANSSDDAAKEGGLWENVYDGQYSSEINDWLYDEERKTGDSTIIYSENAECYFIIYYVGPGLPYAESLAEYDLRNGDYNEWNAALTEDMTLEKTWMFSLA